MYAIRSYYGGISYTNAAEVIDAGADALAVISAVAADPQPVLAARELALLFNRKPSAEHRITSYNVCYTKLLRWLCRMQWTTQHSSK